MTRLTVEDLRNGPVDLKSYDQSLKITTNHGILDLSLKTINQTTEWFRLKLNALTAVAVVPISAGQGILPEFADKIAEVGLFLGFPCRVVRNPDVAGLADAITCGAEILICADDHVFLALNLISRRIIDNASATGQVYAAALDAAAGGVAGKPVGILGIGPVGRSAAMWLHAQGADLIVYDHDKNRTDSFRLPGTHTRKASSIYDVLEQTNIVLDATNDGSIIDAHQLKRPLILAAPGMPLGINDPNSHWVKLIHDPLQLGVAAMLIQIID